MKCCEKEITTPYCPQCGKKNEHPLLGLYRHLSRTADLANTNLNTLRGKKPDDVEQAKHEQRMNRVSKNFIKWRQWANEIKSIIESETGRKIDEEKEEVRGE